MKEIELPPDAARTIEGLRDTGYDFLTAVADIVDNSVAADATRIAVSVEMALDGEVYVCIADNGCGMSEGDLLNAMKYGSRVRNDAASLGKFGLGLKTASTAICRSLTVVTRPQSNLGPFSAQWDLDYVASQNRWLLRQPPVGVEEIDLLDQLAEGNSGTVVIWRKVDRLIPREYVNPSGAAARRALEKQVTDLRKHLELTYVRYLGGTHGRRRIEITLNDAPLEPWDPFGLALGGELVLEKPVPVTIDGEEAEFNLRAYVLPPKPELTEEQQKLAEINEERQGFYVFREDRLIHAGGWLGMFRRESHMSLCRIDFSFDHRLDDALHIDIKKSRIRMLNDLEEAVRRLISPARAEAMARYRRNERTRATKQAPGMHGPSNTIIGLNAAKLSSSTLTVTGPDEATVTNVRTTTPVSISIPVLEDRGEAGPHIVVCEDIEDGLLWRPGLVERKKAVLLNAGHPYYQKVYMGNRGNPLALQGMDFLLWSLCESELGAITEDEKEHMYAVRREVSRILRVLCRDLPEAPDDDAVVLDFAQS